MYTRFFFIMAGSMKVIPKISQDHFHLSFLFHHGLSLSALPAASGAKILIPTMKHTMTLCICQT